MPILFFSESLIRHEVNVRDIFSDILSVAIGDIGIIPEATISLCQTATPAVRDFARFQRFVAAPRGHHHVRQPRAAEQKRTVLMSPT